MKFGLKTALSRTSWDDVLQTWQLADQMDIFESAWLHDHLYPGRGDPSGPCLEAWTALAALGQATQRLRLGILVTANVLRHPGIVANMVATVDHITHGRLEVGLGAGWMQEECDAYGIPFPGLRDRFDMFDEGCEILVRLLTDEVSQFSGRHYQLVDAHCEPKPVQQPHPPICIGGGGEKRTLRSVARYAQHWNFPNGNVAEFIAKREVLRERCEEIGRDYQEIRMSTQVVLDAGNLDSICDTAGEFEQAGLDLFIVYIPAPHDPEVLVDLASRLRATQASTSK